MHEDACIPVVKKPDSDGRPDAAASGKADGAFTCDLDGKEFVSSKALAMHVLRKHQIKSDFSKANTLACDLCDYKTLFPRALVLHKYVRHGIKNKPKRTIPVDMKLDRKWFHCTHPGCTYTARTKASVHSHEIHHEKPAENPTPNALDEPIETASTTSPGEPRGLFVRGENQGAGEAGFTCDRCGKILPSKRGLAIHRSMHGRQSTIDITGKTTQDLCALLRACNDELDKRYKNVGIDYMSYAVPGGNSYREEMR
jgi:hypothetical protein